MNRHFDLGDTPTNNNLARLHHLTSSWKGHEITADEMHDWLIAVIESIDLLPSIVRRHFNFGRYHIGNQHFRVDDKRRANMWRDMAAQLEKELDGVLEDVSLWRKNQPDLTDRPKTRGERIMEVCEKLWTAVERGTDPIPLVASLEHESAGTSASSDASQLRRLLSRKRIPNQGQHKSEVFRLIYHAKIVGQHSHHLA